MARRRKAAAGSVDERTDSVAPETPGGALGLDDTVTASVSVPPSETEAPAALAGRGNPAGPDAPPAAPPPPFAAYAAPPAYPVADGYPEMYDRDAPAYAERAPRRRAETPALVYDPPVQRPPRDFSILRDLGMVVFVVVAVAAGLATWNAVGDATRVAFARPDPTAVVRPSVRPSPTPAASGVITAGASSMSPDASVATASATPEPAPARKAVDVNVVARPKAIFVSERTKTWCAAAAVQIVLNANSGTPDRSAARQGQIHKVQVANTTRADSRNGGVGPKGMVATLNKLGTVDYALHIHRTRAAALRDAAKAIAATGHPAILLAWRGAHAWVMSGFKADADPTLFSDATVKGAYILDPWYPRVSSIWGRSDGPGVYQDAKEMVRNFRPWKRPEGKYAGRDGRFLVIVPTAP